MGILKSVNQVVWGLPMMILILGTGIYLTVGTRVVQVRLFPKAFRYFTRSLSGRRERDGASPFQALCTALGATVGTGNLAGVAGAIAIGGPGSVFWIWVCGLLGMATKFAESVLAVRYRIKNESGDVTGGPMYMIRQGMSSRWGWLATVYAFFGVVAAFGVGNATQINTVIGGANSVITSLGGKETLWGNGLIGLALATVIGLILLGGAKRIGKAAELLVPFAACGYVIMCALVLIIHAQMLPGAFSAIVNGAFQPASVTGGAVGAAFSALQVGVRRGVFTNEAGMGTASIAHSAAKVSHPVEQGFMGIMEVFIDTILICTLTALVILCSGVPIAYGTDTGVMLTAQAFSSLFGNWSQILLTIIVALFALATVLGWGLYGVRCAEFLFGQNVSRWIVWLQIVMVLFGAVSSTATVWLLAEIVNGLMAIPNLIALFALSPELFRLLSDYETRCRNKIAEVKKHHPIMRIRPERENC